MYADVYVVNGPVLSAASKRSRLFLEFFGDLYVNQSAPTARIDCVDGGQTGESLDDPLPLCWSGKFVRLKIDPQCKSRLMKSLDVSFNALVMVTAMELAVSVRVSGWKVNVELQPISGES